MAVLNKAIFLDRDGVINHDPGDYTKSVGEFSILPGVPEQLKRLKEEGFKLILITNQAGIAKGLYTFDAVEEIHAFLEAELKKQDVVLDGIYYSPNHEIKSKSLDRKPGSLMIEKGLAQFQVDPNQSWMIGDKERDLEAARGAGVNRGIKTETNEPLERAVNEILNELR